MTASYFEQTAESFNRLIANGLGQITGTEASNLGPVFEPGSVAANLV